MQMLTPCWQIPVHELACDREELLIAKVHYCKCPCRVGNILRIELASDLLASGQDSEYAPIAIVHYAHAHVMLALPCTLNSLATGDNSSSRQFNTANAYVVLATFCALNSLATSRPNAPRQRICSHRYSPLCTCPRHVGIALHIELACTRE